MSDRRKSTCITCGGSCSYGASRCRDCSRYRPTILCPRCKLGFPRAMFERKGLTRRPYCDSCTVERVRSDSLLKNYGLATEAVDAMLAAQDYRCAICKIHADETPRHVLYVDHCHATGKVRGLLCHNCNTGIGMLGDSPSLLLRAVSYLHDHA